MRAGPEREAPSPPEGWWQLRERLPGRQERRRSAAASYLQCSALLMLDESVAGIHQESPLSR